MNLFPLSRCASATKIVRLLESTPEPQPQLRPALLRLFVRIACLPDERHITALRFGTGIVDKERVYAGSNLDVHQVGAVDPHDVGSRYATASRGDGCAGRRFQADPYHADAGKMLQTHLTYSLNTTRDGGAAAHDQYRSAGVLNNPFAAPGALKAG